MNYELRQYTGDVVTVDEGLEDFDFCARAIRITAASEASSEEELSSLDFKVLPEFVSFLDLLFLESFLSF